MLSMSAAKLSRSSLVGAGGTAVAVGSCSWACSCLIMRSSIILILHSMTAVEPLRQAAADDGGGGRRRAGLRCDGTRWAPARRRRRGPALLARRLEMAEAVDAEAAGRSSRSWRHRRAGAGPRPTARG